MAKHYDLAIIGAGPGGYVAAIRAAQLGLKTVCIDKRAELGGTCLNIGCIPSKSLLQSTEMYDWLRHEGSAHGIATSNYTIDFSQMMKRKNEVVKSLGDGIVGLFKKHDIEFLQGEARFLDPHLIEVSNGKETHQVEAEYILLATGSEPIPLPDVPFDERQILSSTGALSLPKVPKRMAVIGGGAIGVELASVYHRLGCDVTVVEMLNRICPTMDQSISQQLLQVLKKQGMKFMLSSQVITVVKQPDEVILTIQQEEALTNLSVDVVLVAIGRRPYAKGLNLETIGVEVDKQGFVSIDEAFRTAQPHIFAIGDLIQGAMLAHRASEEGVAVAELISNQLIDPVEYATIPNVVYTSPEVAAVGLTEEEALEADLTVKIGKCSFKGIPRARCSGETEGFVKLIGDAKTDRLIGMHILGAHASELIEEGMMAIKKNATLHDLAYAPNAHPTLSEAIKEAALMALGQPIHQ